MDFRERIAEMIVLDDASHDHTFASGKAWAERPDTPRTLVVRHTKNLGYGGNQKAAYKLALERGLDIVVLLHGDGQYAPELLPEMVAPLERGECDAVMGSRMMDKGAARRGGMPLYKLVGNRILTHVENALLGTELTEFHSGYRAYSTRALLDIPFEHNTDDFDFDTQIIVQLIHAGKRILEIPIPTYYGDEICYVNGMRYAMDVVKDVLAYRLVSMGFGTSEWVPKPPDYAFKDGDGSSHAVLLGKLAGLPGSRILDLDCSSGLFAAHARAAGHEVTGVDYLEIPGVRERADHFVKASLEEGIPGEVGGGFDIIVRRTSSSTCRVLARYCATCAGCCGQAARCCSRFRTSRTGIPGRGLLSACSDTTAGASWTRRTCASSPGQPCAGWSAPADSTSWRSKRLDCRFRPSPRRTAGNSGLFERSTSLWSASGRPCSATSTS